MKPKNSHKHAEKFPCQICKKNYELRRMVQIQAHPDGRMYFLCCDCYFNKKGDKL